MDLLIIALALSSRTDTSDYTLFVTNGLEITITGYNGTAGNPPAIP